MIKETISIEVMVPEMSDFKKDDLIKELRRVNDHKFTDMREFIDCLSPSEFTDFLSDEYRTCSGYLQEYILKDPDHIIMDEDIDNSIGDYWFGKFVKVFELFCYTYKDLILK